MGILPGRMGANDSPYFSGNAAIGGSKRCKMGDWCELSISGGKEQVLRVDAGEGMGSHPHPNLSTRALR